MESKKPTRNLPLIYSCSGCSSAAQLANHLAIRMDRERIAEMSCIAGVGGDVPSLVRVAKSGRPIVAIDGCALRCAQSCLKRHGVTPSLHFTLSDFEIEKTFHQDFSSEDATKVLLEVKPQIENLSTAQSSDKKKPPNSGGAMM